MEHTNKTGRQVQDGSILIAKLCSQLLSHKSSGKLHLSSGQDMIPFPPCPFFCFFLCSSLQSAFHLPSSPLIFISLQALQGLGRTLRVYYINKKMFRIECLKLDNANKEKHSRWKTNKTKQNHTPRHQTVCFSIDCKDTVCFLYPWTSTEVKLGNTWKNLYQILFLGLYSSMACTEELGLAFSGFNVMIFLLTHF